MSKNWDKYFMELAESVAKENSSCIRQQIGAVLVRQDNSIISTGYNGAPSGITSCGSKGKCWRIDNNILSGTRHEQCFAIHAEQNCIILAAKHGVSTNHSKIYVTKQPCEICLKMLIQSGVSEIIYKDDYPVQWSEYYTISSQIIMRKYKI